MGRISHWRRMKYGAGKRDSERYIGFCSFVFVPQRRPRPEG